LPLVDLSRQLATFRPRDFGGGELRAGRFVGEESGSCDGSIGSLSIVSCGAGNGMADSSDLVACKTGEAGQRASVRDSGQPGSEPVVRHPSEAVNHK
jgi:hypothetical protein